MAGAIVKTEIHKYKKDLRANRVESIKNCEKWFRSDYFNILTMGAIDPEYIIKEVRKQVKDEEAKKRSE